MVVHKIFAWILCVLYMAIIVLLIASSVIAIAKAVVRGC